jgi:predicted RNA-binding protein
MSGGSFDYLYSAIEDSPLDWGVRDNLRIMAEYLSENGHMEAAKELTDLWDYLMKTEKEIQKRIPQSLRDVMHAVEWWCSSDSDERFFIKEWEAHKSRKIRLSQTTLGEIHP